MYFVINNHVWSDAHLKRNMYSKMSTNEKDNRTCKLSVGAGRHNNLPAARMPRFFGRRTSARVNFIYISSPHVIT